MIIRKKVSILGFMIGSIVDILGTNIWGVVVMFYVLFRYNLLQTLSSPNEITAAMMEIFKTDPLIIAANFMIGSLFLVLGGYVGASIARHDELLNGALSSFLCVSFGIYGIASGSESGLLFLAVLSLVISPLLAMFGGFLRLKQRSRKQVAVVA